VKSIITACKRNQESEHLFWGEVAAVNLRSDTSLTADYMAQLLKQRDSEDVITIYKKNQTLNRIQ
jgi:hypothetical protein